MPDTAAARRVKRRDFVVVSTTQFFLAFALNFMLVFLPFYVHRISTLEEAATLRWLGLIIGAAPAMATFGSTFWGRLTDRFGPKGLFERECSPTPSSSS
jgi:MFS family permease